VNTFLFNDIIYGDYSCLHSLDHILHIHNIFTHHIALISPKAYFSSHCSNINLKPLELNGAPIALYFMDQFDLHVNSSLFSFNDSKARNSTIKPKRRDTIPFIQNDRYAILRIKGLIQQSTKIKVHCFIWALMEEREAYLLSCITMEMFCQHAKAPKSFFDFVSFNFFKRQLRSNYGDGRRYS
jgi:hypothetical protein